MSETDWGEPLCGTAFDTDYGLPIMVYSNYQLALYKEEQKERQATLDAKQKKDMAEAEKDGTLGHDWEFYWLLENDEQYDCYTRKHRDGLDFVSLRQVDSHGLYETVCNNCGAVIRLEMIG